MTRTMQIVVLITAMIQIAGCPLTETTTPLGARVTTSAGEFVIELDTVNAPVTVANFAYYVNDDFYDGTVFHEVVEDILVKAGGWTLVLTEKTAGFPIVNESGNGPPNLRGTVAMARTADPDSATSQFFINLVDNPDLDAQGDTLGYAVFGHVVEGMDVVDQIAGIPTAERDGYSDVPTEDVVIQEVERTEYTEDAETVPAARLMTSRGEILIALSPVDAPISVENFLTYVDEGFYAGTLFHRVVPGFVIQGGGVRLGLAAKVGGEPIANESSATQSNLRGTVAMVLGDGADTATAPFFVNLSDNPQLDASATSPGHTVFGQVIEGMDVIDAIGALPTEPRDGLTAVPVENVLIEDVEIFDLPPGPPQLTPEAESYFSTASYRAQLLLRNLAVQGLGYAIAPP